MYFIFGLIIVAAALMSIRAIGKALMVLVAFAAKACRRVLQWHSARRAIPILRMPTPKLDWEALSRDTRQRLVERGPRVSRETLLLSVLDLEIAVELKKQELQRLKLETAALKAQSAKPHKGRKAAQSDLLGAARPEPATAWRDASAGDNVPMPSDRSDGSRDRPDPLAQGQRSFRPRALQNDRFRH
jgi:hypothetical protein